MDDCITAALKWAGHRSGQDLCDKSCTDKNHKDCSCSSSKYKTKEKSLNNRFLIFHCHLLSCCIFQTFFFSYPKVHMILFAACLFLTPLIQTLHHKIHSCHLQAKRKCQLELLCATLHWIVSAGAGCAFLELESNYPQKKYQTTSSTSPMHFNAILSESLTIFIQYLASAHIVNYSFKWCQRWCLIAWCVDVSPASYVRMHYCRVVSGNTFPFLFLLSQVQLGVSSHCSLMRNFKSSHHH